MTASGITVRRQWAPWRTPWIWRKLRSRSSAHRGSRAAGAAVFRYDGEPSGVGSFLVGALNQFAGGSPVNALESEHPAAFLAGQVTEGGLTEAAGALLSVAGSGGGGDFFDDLDEAAVVILAVIAVALFLMVAIPLGILAVEMSFALLALLVGISLRVAHVRPWTILVRQDGVTTAAFSVTGWRSSHRVVVGLKASRDRLPETTSRRPEHQGTPAAGTPE
jgi:hypothetical protein